MSRNLLLLTCLIVVSFAALALLLRSSSVPASTNLPASGTASSLDGMERRRQQQLENHHCIVKFRAIRNLLREMKEAENEKRTQQQQTGLGLVGSSDRARVQRSCLPSLAVVTVAKRIIEQSSLRTLRVDDLETDAQDRLVYAEAASYVAMLSRLPTRSESSRPTMEDGGANQEKEVVLRMSCKQIQIATQIVKIISQTVSARRQHQRQHPIDFLSNRSKLYGINNSSRSTTTGDTSDDHDNDFVIRFSDDFVWDAYEKKDTSSVVGKHTSRKTTARRNNESLNDAPGASAGSVIFESGSRGIYADLPIRYAAVNHDGSSSELLDSSGGKDNNYSNGKNSNSSSRHFPTIDACLYGGVKSNDILREAFPDYIRNVIRPLRIRRIFILQFDTIGPGRAVETNATRIREHVRDLINTLRGANNGTMDGVNIAGYLMVSFSDVSRVTSWTSGHNHSKPVASTALFFSLCHAAHKEFLTQSHTSDSPSSSRAAPDFVLNARLDLWSWAKLDTLNDVAAQQMPSPQPREHYWPVTMRSAPLYSIAAPSSYRGQPHRNSVQLHSALTLIHTEFSDKDNFVSDVIILMPFAHAGHFSQAVMLLLTQCFKETRFFNSESLWSAAFQRVQRSKFGVAVGMERRIFDFHVMAARYPVASLRTIDMSYRSTFPLCGPSVSTGQLVCGRSGHFHFYEHSSAREYLKQHKLKKGSVVLSRKHK